MRHSFLFTFYSMRISSPDNIAYYPCDVSKWEEVEAASKKIIDEVYYLHLSSDIHSILVYRSVNQLCSSTTLALCKESSFWISSHRISISMLFCTSSVHRKVRHNFQDLWCEYPSPFLDFESILAGNDQKQIWSYCESFPVSR